MTMNKRTLSAAHAALDEIASANPELASALATILKEAAATDTAVQVPSARKPKNTRPVAVDEDEAVLAPKKTRKPKAVAVEEDDEDDADDAEDADDGIVLESLDVDEVLTFLEAVSGDIRDDVEGGLTELRAALSEYGVDPIQLEETANGPTASNGRVKRSARAEVLKAFLSAVKTTVEHIAEYELDDISAAYTEVTGEDMPKLRGRTDEAKALYAADLYIKAVLSDDADEDDADDADDADADDADDEEEVKPRRASAKTTKVVKEEPKRTTRRTTAKEEPKRRKRSL